MKRKEPILIILGTVLAASLIYFGAYKSILLLFHKHADAQVVGYAQDSPGNIRAGDWRLRYEFSTGSGETHIGQVIFAPKNRPPEGIRRIKVRYLPWAPAVYEVEGNITPTGLVGFALALLLVVRGLSGKSKTTESGASASGRPAKPTGI